MNVSNDSPSTRARLHPCRLLRAHAMSVFLFRYHCFQFCVRGTCFHLVTKASISGLGFCQHGRIRAFATDSCWSREHLKNSSILKKVRFLHPSVYLLLKTTGLLKRGNLCGNESLCSGPRGGDSETLPEMLNV